MQRWDEHSRQWLVDDRLNQESRSRCGGGVEQNETRLVEIVPVV